MAPGTEYTPSFYDIIADGSRASAAIIAPLVVRDVAPRTVIDVGCGQGWWGAEFARLGADVVGIDGAYVQDRALPHFVEHDLREPLPDVPRADLVVCLEVAEHLPERRAASFIADLCRLGDHVLFSAAIPHQTGAGHIHLRWSSYWAALFLEHGYGCDTSLRWEVWDDARVEPWYRQNIMLASIGYREHAGPLDVVHPIIHEWGRTR